MIFAINHSSTSMAKNLQLKFQDHKVKYIHNSILMKDYNTMISFSNNQNHQENEQ